MRTAQDKRWEASERRRRDTVLSFGALSEARQLDLVALHGAERTRWDIFHDEMESLGMPDELLRTMPGHGWPCNYEPYWMSLP